MELPVSQADTVSDVRAMMVEMFHASVAELTVFGPHRFHQLTSVTETPQQFLQLRGVVNCWSR